MIRSNQARAQKFCDKLNLASPLVHWYAQDVDSLSVGPVYGNTMLLYYRIHINDINLEGIYPINEIDLQETRIPEHEIIKMILERVLHDALHKALFYRI